MMPTWDQQRARVATARRGLGVLALAGLAALGAACAAGRAAPPPDPEPPTPPTGDAAPSEEPSAPAAAVPTVPSESAPPPSPAGEAATTPPMATATAPAPEADAAPPRRLRTAGTTRSPQAIRQMLDRAAAQLALVDRRQLGRSDRSQFDTALQFIELAEAALDMDNVVFATQLADKASTLADALAMR